MEKKVSIFFSLHKCSFIFLFAKEKSVLDNKAAAKVDHVSLHMCMFFRDEDLVQNKSLSVLLKEWNFLHKERDFFSKIKCLSNFFGWLYLKKKSINKLWIFFDETSVWILSMESQKFCLQFKRKLRKYFLKKIFNEKNFHYELKYHYFTIMFLQFFPRFPMNTLK